MFFHHVKVKQCGSIRNIEALIENYRFYLLVLRIILIVDPRTEFGWQLQVFLLDLHHGFGCGKRRARHDRTWGESYWLLVLPGNIPNYLIDLLHCQKL